jgi:hypothetical protein
MLTALLLAASVALIGSAADCVTTAVALRRKGVEVSPGPLAVFGKNPVLGSAIVSVLFVGGSLVTVSYVPSSATAAQITLWAFAALRLGATALNLKAINRRKA